MKQVVYQITSSGSYDTHCCKGGVHFGVGEVLSPPPTGHDEDVNDTTVLVLEQKSIRVWYRLLRNTTTGIAGRFLEKSLLSFASFSETRNFATRNKVTTTLSHQKYILQLWIDHARYRQLPRNKVSSCRIFLET